MPARADRLQLDRAAPAAQQPARCPRAPQSAPPGSRSSPSRSPSPGNFFHLSSFIGRLQRFVVDNNNNLSVSGRLMSLNGITLQPSPNGFPEITATVTATTYLLPASEGLLNGATPAGPTSSSTTQTVSNSSPASSSSSASSAPPAVVTSPVR